jgi:hypothetical protein
MTLGDGIEREGAVLETKSITVELGKAVWIPFSFSSTGSCKNRRKGSISQRIEERCESRVKLARRVDAFSNPISLFAA